jgi:hypothetical protein
MLLSVVAAAADSAARENSVALVRTPGLLLAARGALVAKDTAGCTAGPLAFDGALLSPRTPPGAPPALAADIPRTVRTLASRMAARSKRNSIFGMT